MSDRDSHVVSRIDTKGEIADETILLVEFDFNRLAPCSSEMTVSHVYERMNQLSVEPTCPN